MSRENDVDREVTREEFILALRTAYDLGAQATKAVNFGRKGFTASMEKRERTTLNRLLRLGGAAPLSDEEYQSVCGE